jgi:hypothetical protein
MTDTWLVNKLDADVIFRAALYKERAETVIDGVRCEVDVICPNNVVAYLAARALKDAQLEVKAAGATLLSHAYGCGALRHKDEHVYRRARETLGDVARIHYEPRHADEAREFMARELRRCVVCRIDTFALFERFVKCVETGGGSYLFIIRRDSGAFHVMSDNLADALDRINMLLMAQYRVVVEPDIETFETLAKIYAKTYC